MKYGSNRGPLCLFPLVWWLALRLYLLGILEILICSPHYVTGTESSWMVQVQIHNYSNPYGAFHDFTNSQPCCCQEQDLTHHCADKASNLDCGVAGTDIAKYCDSVLDICIQGNCLNYSQVLSNGTNILGVSVDSDQLSLFPTILYQGTSTGTISVIVNIRHYSSALSPGDYLIDNITIPIKISVLDHFSTLDVTGIYDIATVGIAYQFWCMPNYYSTHCSIYCLSGSEDTFTCSNEGVKICDQGYTNPENDCKDKVTTTTSSITSCSVAPPTQPPPPPPPPPPGPTPPNDHSSSITSSIPLSVSSDSLPSSSVPLSSSNVPATSSVPLPSSVPSLATSNIPLPSSNVPSLVTSNALLQPSSNPLPVSRSATTHSLAPLAQSSVVPVTSTSATNGTSVLITQNKSSICDRVYEKNTGFNVVLSLLVLTYIGVGLYIAIKLMIYFTLCKKKREWNFPGLRPPSNNEVLNPNYIDQPLVTAEEEIKTQRFGTVTTGHSNWFEKSDDSEIYAPLVNTTGKEAAKSNKEASYELIDSRSIQN